MDNRFRQQWENLGASDPYWGVLSDPDKIAGGWDREEFFQTGADEISEVLDKLESLEVQPEFGLALDYGCGVGRLTRALADPFDQVVGVDISSTMLAEAQAEHDGYDNIDFIQGSGTSLKEIACESVDFIYTNIVLQHTPRSAQRSLINEFCRVLNPGGHLVFQTPSHQNLKTLGGIAHLLLGNRFLNLASSLRYGRSYVMEMHTLSRRGVLSLLADEKMVLLDIEEDDSAGPAFVSYRYFVEKNEGTKDCRT